jgi:membrane protein
MSFALGLIAFGSVIENWLALKLGRDIGYYLLLLFLLARWLIAGITSVTVIMLIYHWALPRVQPWHRVLPGAVLATILWFPFTLAFGRYVTRYATYNLFYGPLGAAIALLVWLYSLSIIILIGAEFNALANPREVPHRRKTDPQPD